MGERSRTMTALFVMALYGLLETLLFTHQGLSNVFFQTFFHLFYITISEQVYMNQQGIEIA